MGTGRLPRIGHALVSAMRERSRGRRIRRNDTSGDSASVSTPALGGLKQKVRQVLRKELRGPIGRLGLRQGALTAHLLDSYCSGMGAEIGAGGDPYTDRASTLLVDRRIDWAGTRRDVDIIADGANIPLRSGSLDYLLASHCLEHQPDVIAALLEWRRVVRLGGYLFLVLPHANRTFDRGRPVHDAKHHWDEFGRSDSALLSTHWTDFEGVISAAAPMWAEDPRARTKGGEWNREWIANEGFIHYHAWTQNEVAFLLQSLNLELVVLLERMPEREDSFIVVCRLNDDGASPLHIGTNEDKLTPWRALSSAPPSHHAADSTTDDAGVER